MSSIAQAVIAATPKIVTPKPGMRQRLAPVGARQVRAPGAASRRAPPRPRRHAAGDLGERAEHQPGGERDADRREHRAAGLQRPDERAERHREREHAPERLASRGARPPRFQGRAAKSGRIAASATMNGVKARSKNGGPTETLRPVSTSATQRPDRAEEDDEGRDDEQEVVDDQPALAADGGEDRVGAQRRRAPGVERQRPADEGAEDPEQEDPALGVVGEGVHAR